MRKQWTYPEIEKLKELRAAGLSQSEIGLKLGRSKSSVQTMCGTLTWSGDLAPITRAERSLISQRARARRDATQFRLSA